MASVSLGTGMVLNPTSVALATQDNYVSALTTAALAMHKRDVDENFVKRYGNQGITGLLELVGAKKETTQTQFEHYEEAFIHNSVLLTAAATTFGTGVEEFNYAAEDNTDQLNGTDDIVGSNTDTPVRVGDILMAPNGELGYVSAVTAATGNVFMTCLSGTFTFSDTAQLRFAIVGNAHAEGSDQPGSLMPRVHTYTNKVMIIKESFEVSGTEATNVVYFKVDNEKMGSGYLWYLKGEADTYKRFLDYCELQLIIGQENANVTAGYTGTDIRGTEGLLSFIENRGQSMDLGASSITMADFDAMVKSLDKYRGAKEMALYAGIDLSLDIDDLLAAQGAYASGGANYGTFQNKKDMALNLGFNSFTRGGYTFHKKTYDVFNHPKLLGTAGSNFSGYGMCIPMDTQRDAKSGSKIPSLRIRYKAANGYSREMEHWLTGSAVLKNKTNDSDHLKSHYRTERGFEGFAPNRFMLIKKS
tara:strand:- start:544 stop:1962 length:1419 start_codon:yes stop_codon:yes gene_type:complete